MLPRDVVLDGGSPVKPNKYQRTTWKYWLNFWNRFIPEVTQKAESITIVVNGDIIEGYHHDTVDIWTNNIETQIQAAKKMLEPLKELGNIYLVRGTETHVGKGGQDEESIAQSIGTKIPGEPAISVWQLHLKVDDVVFQFAHHIGVTSSAAYESSAPMREIIAGEIEAIQWDRPLPDVLVRSHRHRFIEVSIPTTHGRIRCVITPGWQTRTPHVESIDRMRMPHIGGVVFLVEGDQCQVIEKIYPLPEPKTVTI
jgi:hypothetical protein